MSSPGKAFQPPMVPERTSSLIPARQRAHISTLKKSHLDLKRKVSELSTSSSHGSYEFLDAKINELECEDQQLQVLQDGLKEAFTSGQVPQDTFKELYHDSFNKRLKVAAEDVTIKRQRERIMNQLVGNADKLEPDVAAAYTAIITQMFQNDTKNHNHGDKRTGQQQTAWGNQLREWYNAVSPTDKKSYWCPILKQYGNKHYRCAAHIAPYGIGFANLEYLFGEDKGCGKDIVWRMENAIVMAKSLEVAFDKGYFVLVPITTESDKPRRWKFVLLNDSVRMNYFGEGGGMFNDLDGKELEWKNDNRPAARYLYYHYCVSVLRAIRYQTPGWADAKVRSSTGRVWATWGPYLRRSMLVKLGEALGDTKLPDEFVKEGTFETNSGRDNDEEEMIKAKEIMIRELKPTSLERTEGFDNDSEDEEESDSEEDEEEEEEKESDDEFIEQLLRA